MSLVLTEGSIAHQFPTGMIILDQNIPVPYVRTMANNLATYLSNNSISQKAFGESIDATQATVSRLASGSIEPSLALAVKIENATGGFVTAQSWVKEDVKGAA